MDFRKKWNSLAKSSRNIAKSLVFTLQISKDALLIA